MDESNKTVNIDYPELKGVVTYTGIGKWSNVDISTYVGEWIAGPTSLGLDEIAGTIREQADALFAEIEAQVGRQSHTFVLAAFEEGQPSVCVVSNFQDAYGESTLVPNSRFEVSSRPFEHGGDPFVLVTGWTAGVSSELMAHLSETVATHPNDGGRIRRLLMNTNAKVSEGALSESAISRDCIVRSIHKNGKVNAETSGTGAPFAPDIRLGVDMSIIMRDALRSIGFNPDEMTLTQSTGARFGPNRPVVTPNHQCDQTVVAGDGETEHRLESVQSIDFSVLGATAINESGWIVGTGREGWDASTPDWLPWLFRDGHFTKLNFVGYPKAVGDDGRVIGVDNSDLPSQHGIRWTEGDLERIVNGWTSSDLAFFDSFLPASQNENGEVAGHVSIILPGKGTVRSVACVYSRDGAVLPSPVPELNANDRAMSISQDGTVLVCQYQVPSTHLINLWNIHDGSVIAVGNDATRSIVPIAFRADGTVFGQARDDENRLVAVVTDHSKNWMRLGTPPDFAISAINNTGDIVGTTKIDGLQRPWVRLASGELSLLPYFSEHHCHPAAINGRGVIVGSATSDSCSHALRWLR